MEKFPGTDTLFSIPHLEQFKNKYQMEWKDLSSTIDLFEDLCNLIYL